MCSEWCAETAFPLSESTSGAIYQLAVNTGTCLFLLATITLRTLDFNFLVCVVLPVSLFALYLVKPSYNRLDLHDAREVIEEQGSQVATVVGVMKNQSMRLYHYRYNSLNS